MRLIFALIVPLSLTCHALAEDAALPAPAEKPEVTKQRQIDQLLAKLHTAPADKDMSSTEDEIWQLWSRHSSPTAEVLLREGSAAIANGDYDPAEQILSQVLETYPNYAEAWNRRAALYYAEKRYDTALIDVDHALSLEPRNFGALIGKGLILRAQNKDNEAEAAFKAALEINPHLDSVQAMLNKIKKERPDI